MNVTMEAKFQNMGSKNAQSYWKTVATPTITNSS